MCVSKRCLLMFDRRNSIFCDKLLEKDRILEYIISENEESLTKNRMRQSTLWLFDA